MKKRFITNTLLIVIILFVAVFSMDYIITKGLKKSNSIYFNNLTKIFNGNLDTDLLIMGSSKAYVQISPTIIENKLNIRSHNIALDGNPFFVQSVLFDKFLQYNNMPKFVIQVVSNSTLTSNENSNEIYLYQKFLPYFDDIDVRDMLMSSEKNISKFIRYIPILKFHGQKLFIAEGILSFFGVNNSSKNLQKGFNPQNKQWDNKMYDKFIEINRKKNAIQSDKFDNQTLEKFVQYIKKCKQNNIELILVYPPIYHKSQNNLVDEYHSLAKNHKIKFYDFSHYHKLSLDRNYFYDSQHLNKKGAEIFTSDLSDLIKSEFSNHYLLKSKIN